MHTWTDRNVILYIVWCGKRNTKKKYSSSRAGRIAAASNSEKAFLAGAHWATTADDNDDDDKQEWEHQIIIFVELYFAVGKFCVRMRTIKENRPNAVRRT